MAVNVNAGNRESGSIKKMIRDTNRLLNRPNLPADMRQEQERKLAALQVALSDRQKGEVEREMSVKYRMVKFFERKKALRRLASAQASGDSEAVSEAQLDLAYILHFPKDRKYISLYPVSESTSSEVLAEREVIRKQISKKLAVMGAEVLLAKGIMGSTKVKKALQDSDEEDSEDEDSEDEDSDNEDSDNEDDNSEDEAGSDDDSDNEDSDDNDSEDELSYDEDSDDDDEDQVDGSDDDSDNDDEDSEDADSDSEDGSGSGSDSEDDSEDEDSDSEEEEEDSDAEDDLDAPKPKKIRS